MYNKGRKVDANDGRTQKRKHCDLLKFVKSPFPVKIAKPNPNATGETYNVLSTSIFKRQNLFKNTQPESICPNNDESALNALKRCFNLSNGKKNDLISRISIKTIQDNIKAWNGMDDSISVPFLAAIIIDDNGMNLTPNEPVKKQTRFTIILKDRTGSISTEIDIGIVMRFGYLLRPGTSMLLRNFRVDYEKQQLSLTKETVTSLVVNTKYVDFHSWRDTPQGFWIKKTEKDAIILQQYLYVPKTVYNEISEFKCRNSHSHKVPYEEKKIADLAIGSVSQNVLHGDFVDDEDDYVFLDPEVTKIADKRGDDFIKHNDIPKSSATIAKKCERQSESLQGSIQQSGEFQDDGEDHIFLADNIIKLADMCDSKIHKNRPEEIGNSIQESEDFGDENDDYILLDPIVMELVDGKRNDV